MNQEKRIYHVSVSYLSGGAGMQSAKHKMTKKELVQSIGRKGFKLLRDGGMYEEPRYDHFHDWDNGYDYHSYNPYIWNLNGIECGTCKNIKTDLLSKISIGFMFFCAVTVLCM